MDKLKLVVTFKMAHQQATYIWWFWLQQRAKVWQYDRLSNRRCHCLRDCQLLVVVAENIEFDIRRECMVLRLDYLQYNSYTWVVGAYLPMYYISFFISSHFWLQSKFTNQSFHFLFVSTKQQCTYHLDYTVHHTQVLIEGDWIVNAQILCY